MFCCRTGGDGEAPLQQGQPRLRAAHRSLLHLPRPHRAAGGLPGAPRCGPQPALPAAAASQAPLEGAGGEFTSLRPGTTKSRDLVRQPK